MRIAIVSDAWEPQVNGVVRTLQATRTMLEERGHCVEIIGPDRFPSMPCPTYPEIRLALAGRVRMAQHFEAFAPDALHIATEGPLGWSARRWAKRQGVPFTTAFHSHFPEYVRRRTGLSPAFIWKLMRRFHEPSSAVLCATPTLASELNSRGIGHTHRWSRGVDLAAFSPEGPLDDGMVAAAGLQRKLLYVGRVAIEKNLEAFLSLDTDEAKFVVGDGPQRAELERRFPTVHFLGNRTGTALAAAYRTADVFVFPSLTDTFGLVMIEALACGTPVAAFDVMGPCDVLDCSVGAIGQDLAANIERAAMLSRQCCVRYAQSFSWKRATDQFEHGLRPFHGDGIQPISLSS